MLIYVEVGTKFTCEFGDIDSRFYDSLCSVLEELRKLLLDPAAEHYPAAAPRLAIIKLQTTDIGWGYGNVVSDVVDELSRAV